MGVSRKKFVEKVQEIAQVSDPQTAEAGAEVVLHTLSHRLTREEAEDVCSQLTRDLKQLWHDENFVERLIPRFKTSQLKFKNRIQMYQHIHTELEKKQIAIDNLEPFTIAVFHVLKEQIDAGEAEDVAAQLPEEIKQMWWAA